MLCLRWRKPYYIDTDSVNSPVDFCLEQSISTARACADTIGAGQFGADIIGVGQSCADIISAGQSISTTGACADIGARQSISTTRACADIIGAGQSISTTCACADLPDSCLSGRHLLFQFRELEYNIADVRRRKY